MYSKCLNYLRTDHRWLFALIALGAAVGFIASFVLSNDAVILAKDSNTVLTCDVNSAISCGAVGRDPSASIFGFPNAFIGVSAFSVILTIAVAGLMGAKLPKVFMFLAEIGGVLGFLFAAWMFFTSYFVIGALCPWCLTTDVATLLILFALTRHNIIENNLFLAKKTRAKLLQYINANYDVVVAISIIVIVALGIFLKFGKQLF